MASSIDVLLNKVYKVIADVYNTEVPVETEKPEFPSYPFPTARKGHNRWIRYILNSKDICYLTLPTGYGKTAIYLTAAAESGLRTLVIVPRNQLQEQVAFYAHRMDIPILYLYKRTKMCNKDPRNPPCLRKFRVGGDWYFKFNDKLMEYPCSDCPYERRKRIIKDLFKEGRCIAVLNHGNFWVLRAQAEFVVIDEADETLRSMTEAVSYPEWYKESKDPHKVLDWMEEKVTRMIENILEALEDVRQEDTLFRLNNTLNSLVEKLRKIEFFKSYPAEKLVTYIKGRSTYVEIFDSPENIVRRIFPDAKICLVTATPPLNASVNNNNDNSSSDVMPFRAKVIYAPVGDMSVANVFIRGRKELLEKAAEFIVKSYNYVVKLTGMRKAPVHCGNLGKHGIRIYELLKESGLKVLLMEEGKQMEVIKKFLEEDYDLLCVVAAEYGFDWGFSPIQYIVKVPYAYKEDPRLKAIKSLLGDQKFSEYYEWDALSRLIQASGRNARDPNDFGITIILDSRFEKLYYTYKDRIPQWFKDRLVWLDDSKGNSS